MLCPRSLRRILRCGGSRKMFVDLFFILLFIIACSIVISHLHASPPLRVAPLSVLGLNSGIDNNKRYDEIRNQPVKKNEIEERVLKVKDIQDVVDVFPPKRESYKGNGRIDAKYINGIAYPQLNSAGNFIPIQRIVHLDLKGGAYKPYFFNQIFGLIKDLRATGVLIEWEDMFPYSGRLSSAVNGNAYSLKEVEGILKSARHYGLEIIPLVQTFGHLEWILKLKQFAHLRESALYPQVICFGLEEAWELVKEMIDEVYSVHSKFGMRYFHMGADEVFQIGYCNGSLQLMDKEGSKERAMLWHMARVSEYIRRKQDISVMAWHDMLVQAAEEDLRRYRMPQLIEPVLWSYAEQLDLYLSPSVWFALKPFGKVWGASVYKGADGPMRFRSNPIHYIRNNEAWIDQMTNNYRDFEYIQGIVLSGWSRYDHMAILCELFPVSVPSLAMSLETLIEGRKLDGNYPFTVNLFKCSPPMEPGFVYGCQFPSHKVYELINEFDAQHEQLQLFLRTDFEFNGWLSKTAIQYRHSSPMYLEKILHLLEFYLLPFEKLEVNLRQEMERIYFNDTIDEFIFTYMDDDLSLLRERYKIGTEMIKQRYFPRRPYVKPPLR